MDPLLEGFITDVDPTFNEESFAKLVNDCLNGEPEESPVYQRVERIYGARVAWALARWLQIEGGDVRNGTRYNNLKTNEVMQLLINIPTDKALQRLRGTLGGGMSGVAVKLKNGLVIKKLFSDFKHQDNAKFYEYCLKAKPSCFLSVVKIGKDYIISKEVESASNKCRHYVKEIDDAISELRKQLRSTGERIPDLYSIEAPFIPFIKDPEVKQWCLEVQKYLKLAGPRLDFSDIKPLNLGEENGKVLYIDP